jgi:hypothetical protein
MLFFGLSGRFIKKYSTIYYISISILSLLCIFLYSQKTPFIVSIIVNTFVVSGNLAGALFIVVMYATILQNPLKQIAIRMRAEMAITASIFTLAHNITYGQRYFVNFFTKFNKLGITTILATIISMIMILLLIPLTVTSFQSVRSKMNPKSWKKLQSLSYVFYGLLYAHISLMFFRALSKGRLIYAIDLCIYTIIWGIYLAFKYAQKKTAKLSKIKDKDEKASALSNINKVKTGLIVLTAFLCVGISSFGVYASNLANSDSNSTSKKISSSENASSVSAETTLSESSDNSDKSKENSSGLKDGEYEGKGNGRNGKIEVKLTVANGEIKAIEVTKQSEDDEYYDGLEERMIPQIITKQSTEIDVVSGATESFDGIIAAVNDALSKAK